MIIPIILDYNLLCKDKLDGLWIFYKFLEFAEKYNSCIIGREIYYEHPKKYEDTWHLSESTRKFYDYKYPNKKFLDKNKKYMISNEIEEYLNNSNYTWNILLTKSCPKLEKEIENKLDLIEQDKNKKISTIITWYPFYSLEKICKTRGINYVCTELTSIRKEWYNYTLGTISCHNKYKSNKDYEKIKEFNEEKSLILTREELIILFSYTKDIESNLKLLKNKPIYEIGYALGLDKDPYELAFSKLQKDDIIKELIKNYDKSNILFRKHPQSQSNLSEDLNIDKSNFAKEFISKCDKMIISLSNIGYEAMLYGRKVTHLNGDFISSLGKKYDINLLNDSIEALKELNFITFYLYTPIKLIFDIDYINSIFDKKETVNSLYEKKLKYILNDFKIDYYKMFHLPVKERKKYLLKTIHNFTDEDIKKIENIAYNREEENYKLNLKKQQDILKYENKELIEQIKKLKEEQEYLKNVTNTKDKKMSKLLDENEKLQKEITSIYESNSWKCTKFARLISEKLKGNKR